MTALAVYIHALSPCHNGVWAEGRDLSCSNIKQVYSRSSAEAMFNSAQCTFYIWRREICLEDIVRSC